MSSLSLAHDRGPWALRSGCAAACALLVGCAWALKAAGAPQVLLMLFVAPMLEEAAFRAGLHEFLLRRRLSPLAANAATAAAFAAAHGLAQADLRGLLVFGPALLVGAVYNRWHRLRWCVLLHAALNAGWLAMSLVRGAA
jgi:membrane protease YdiL (CAAX protease family)